METEDQFSQTPDPGHSPQPRAKKFKLPIIAVLGAILITLTAMADFDYWLKENSGRNQSGTTQNSGISQNPNDSSRQTSTSTADQSNSSDNASGCDVHTPATRQLSGQIAWSEAQVIAPLDIFSHDSDGSGFVEQNSKFYRVGGVVSGSYSGWEVILADIAVEGPVLYPNYYRFLRQGGKLALLGKYSPEFNDWDGLDHSKITLDNAYYVSDLDYPETFQGATNRENFQLDKYATFKFCSAGLTKLFHHPVLGDVYSTAPQNSEGRAGLAKNRSSYGFYAASPDGTAKVYMFIVDFQGPDNVPKITWSDGSENTVEYTFTDVGGCGSTNYLSVMTADKLEAQTDLAEAGTNIFGDNIYVLKNQNHSLLKDIYDNQYYVYQGEKISFGEFTENRPVFFWHDPFGRLVKFQNNKFVPLAECGKPVIYLYPEKTRAISVKLAPVGGLSFTEPAYGQGWNIVANPAGELINQTDGKVYPYLFWEGRGGLYQTSDKGFVVERQKVHEFLVEKLAKLGLNAKESADFVEFWEPRMQGAPYYFVTFYGNSVMDYLAPLTITPAPDTVIRVLMDFTPLAGPREAEGYEIQTPARRGFTVVEWGGVLRSR